MAAKGSVTALATAQRGNTLAVARANEVEIKASIDGKVLHKLPEHIGQVQALEFSADDSLLLAAAGEAGLFGEAKLWNVADGACRVNARRSVTEEVGRFA